MGQNRLDSTDFLERRRVAYIEDDFFSYTDTQLWTKTITGAGATLTNPDASGGVVSLGNAGSAANCSVVMATTAKDFLFAANRPMYAECELQYAEAATNGAGIFFGWASAAGATFLANTTFIPVVTGSAVGVYKQAGDTFWRGLLNVNGVQLLTGLTIESSQPSPTTTFQRLAVKVDVIGTNIEASFFCGQRDTVGADATAPAALQQFREGVSGFNKPLKLRMATTSAVVMPACFILKQLNAGNAETLVVDYCHFGTLRTT